MLRRESARSECCAPRYRGRFSRMNHPCEPALISCISPTVTCALWPWLSWCVSVTAPTRRSRFSASRCECEGNPTSAGCGSRPSPAAGRSCSTRGCGNPRTRTSSSCQSSRSLRHPRSLLRRRRTVGVEVIGLIVACGCFDSHLLSLRNYVTVLRRYGSPQSAAQGTEPAQTRARSRSRAEITSRGLPCRKSKK